MGFLLFLTNRREAILRAALVVILALGVVLRLLMFFHNRNLIIDEANIVRNLAERDFAGLLHPLKYEQYAPPGFLWVEELASIVFGYGEKAMRLYSLLCGIGVLILFPIVAKKMIRLEAVWLPFAYLAGGTFIKYSAEVKQYMPDTLIALLLIWLALQWDLRKMSRSRFALAWIVVSSVAVWMSMPSVFILTGISCYYVWTAISTRQAKDILPVSVFSLCWMAQFAVYYFLVLQDQVNGQHLQIFHQDYFLYAIPSNKAEWLHNWTRLEDILGNIGGWTAVAVVFNLLLVIVGFVYLIARRFHWLILIALPIMLVLVAASLHKFTLIDRVVLFMFPLWLILLGFGFQTLWNTKAPVKVLLVVVGVFNAFTHLSLHWLVRPYEFHEITKGMDWLKMHGAKGSQLYVHDANTPTYIYYTSVHPWQAKYSSLKGAHLLAWGDDYSQVTANIQDTAYFIYTGGFPESERQKRTGEIEKNMKQISYFEYAVCYVFGYVPKSPEEKSAGH